MLPPKTSRIPKFRSRQEEAEWWDTHDTTDFEDEFTPIKVIIAPEFSHALIVDLPVEALTALDERAKRQGIGPSTLARQWIEERLRADGHLPGVYRKVGR